MDSMKKSSPPKHVASKQVVPAACTNDVKQIQCPSCARCFLSSELLTNHIVEQHPTAMPPFACIICSTALNTLEQFQDHMQMDLIHERHMMTYLENQVVSLWMMQSPIRFWQFLYSQSLFFWEFGNSLSRSQQYDNSDSEISNLELENSSQSIINDIKDPEKVLNGPIPECENSKSRLFGGLKNAQKGLVCDARHTPNDLIPDSRNEVIRSIPVSENNSTSELENSPKHSIPHSENSAPVIGDTENNCSIVDSGNMINSSISHISENNECKQRYTEENFDLLVSSNSKNAKLPSGLLNIRRFQCQICSNAYTTMSSLNRHMNKIHTEIMVQ